MGEATKGNLRKGKNRMRKKREGRSVKTITRCSTSQGRKR